MKYYRYAKAFAKWVYIDWKKHSIYNIVYSTYDFGVLNELTEEDFIRQGSHLSKTKMVYITETGEQLARELMKKYGVEDWKLS